MRDNNAERQSFWSFWRRTTGLSEEQILAEIDRLILIVNKNISQKTWRIPKPDAGEIVGLVLVKFVTEIRTYKTEYGFLRNCRLAARSEISNLLKKKATLQVVVDSHPSHGAGQNVLEELAVDASCPVDSNLEWRELLHFIGESRLQDVARLMVEKGIDATKELAEVLNTTPRKIREYKKQIRSKLKLWEARHREEDDQFYG